MSTKPKEIIFEEEARNKLKEGIDKLSNVLAVTLGPKGKNVGFESSIGCPKITNDGANISSDIELKDQFENMGVLLAQEAINKIKEKSGDGTTTGVILLRSLVENSIKNITSGTSPIEIKRGFKKTLKKVLQEMDKNSKKIKNEKETENIATISASGDKEIGKMIKEAFKKVGVDGVVTIEEAKSIDTTMEMVEGMEFDKGYLSPYFCTNMEKLKVEMNNPYILITDKKISSIQEILPILQTIAPLGRELLIIADDLEGDALSTLVINKLRQTLKVAAVKAPEFGDFRKKTLEDIAILTKANFITEDKGLNLKDISLDDLGNSEKIIINSEKTTIINGKGEKKDIEKRISSIENEITLSKEPYEKEKLKKRKAKLKGGVAVIRVGALTENELKQKKQSFEDSLNATKAALEEGIVPGGGISFINASNALRDLTLPKGENIGKNILRKALFAPLKQIIENSGYNFSITLEKIESKGKNFGFNVFSEKVEDLLEKGIIDPLKVVKNSLILAVSTACTVILSEVLVGEARDERKK
jgi:chaperonin GroEL